jgi:hypothetical protein
MPGSPLIEIVPDAQWPKMWRIKYPDDRISDMVNLSRARDAAMDAALANLNLKQSGHVRSGPPSDFLEQAATPTAEGPATHG